MAPLSYAQLSHLKWNAQKMARRSRRAIYSKLYQDKHTDSQNSIIVAGTGRSGTTWLADLIASQMPARILFEPFHPKLVQDYAAFNYFQYMRPEQDNKTLLDIVQRVLSGRIRNPWIDRQVETLWPQQRIIKEIRACLFLRWIHDRFPEVPLLFIMRHPCAVVASRLKLNWATDDDIKPFLDQKPLLDDFLGQHLATIHNAKTDAEKHAIIWCVSNLVPLQQFRDASLHVVYYENLYLYPEREIPKIFDTIKQPYTASVFKHVKRPSTTTQKQSALLGNRSSADAITSWQRELSATTIAKIRQIVAEFELDDCYDEAGLPLQTSVNE